MKINIVWACLVHDALFFGSSSSSSFEVCTRGPPCAAFGMGAVFDVVGLRLHEVAPTVHPASSCSQQWWQVVGSQSIRGV
jgi:hypothetical protein